MLLSILISSTKTLSVHPRYFVHFPLTHLPGQGTQMAKHSRTGSTASLRVGPANSSRRAPLSLTKTMKTGAEPTPVQHCSSQAGVEGVVPVKCAPLELRLDNCSLWPQSRSSAFSLSLWILVETDVEFSSASHSVHSVGSLSATDCDFLPPGI